MIFTLTFRVKTEHDAIIPPFSSKVSRTLLFHFSPSFSNLIESSEPFKPVRVTVLKDEGKPLFSLGDRMLTLKGGKEYTFSVTTTKQEIVKEVMGVNVLERELFNTKFSAELVNMSIKEDFLMEDSRHYLIRFMTPTLLQPPRPRIKRKENRYVLFPYTPLLLFSFVSNWNKMMRPRITGVLGSKALYYFREVNYNLRPVTVRYDSIINKGFVGWTKFELRARRNSKLRVDVRRLLDFANYFGVGKSRSIGFGEVEVKPVNQ